MTKFFYLENKFVIVWTYCLPAALVVCGYLLSDGGSRRNTCSSSSLFVSSTKFHILLATTQKIVASSAKQLLNHMLVKLIMTLWQNKNYIIKALFFKMFWFKKKLFFENLAELRQNIYRQ